MKILKILIIGATSAIASEVTRIYAAQGHALYLLARDGERLAALVAELEARGADLRGHASGDLDDLERNAGRVTAAIEALGTIDIALIAHGYLGDQRRSESSLDEALKILGTNFTSPISLLIPLANHFEGQGAGHLAAITSVAGERGRPRNFTYGAAKGGLSRYLEGQRSRLRPRGVFVHNIKLGPVDTPMTIGHEKNVLFADKRAVAQTIVRVLGGRRHAVYVPWFWGVIMAIVRMLPEPLFARLKFLSGR
jgi:decaprenylphospho-beta-D-erythro-pentofuranosid-2-ulose 2-reductase